MDEIKRKSRILLVCEDAKWLQSIQAMLAHLGVEILPACHELEAMREARKAPFDLVILDFQAPRNEDLALLKYLRANAAALPILAFYAQAGEDTPFHAQLWRAGANAVLGREQAATHLASLVTIILMTRVLNGSLQGLHPSIHLRSILHYPA